jgi:Lon protease-like protein
MQGTLLPLFPLRLVLLPGASLPLHIFEDRYKEMIGEALKNSTEFGVVQAGDKGILNIGCTATVSEVVNRYDDGRLDIVTVGRRRFEIFMLDEEKSYLRGAVTFFDDDDDAEPAPVELKAVALAGLKVLSGGQESVEPQDYADPRISFKVGHLIADLPFRQMLLGLRSETDRLKQIASYLPEYLAKLKRVEHVKKVAPTNGHGMRALSDTE